jgi:PEP-CTERM motif
MGFFMWEGGFLMRKGELMTENFRSASKFRWCIAGVLALSVSAIASQSAWAIIDYSSSLATEFKATFPGGDPGAGAPTANPFGDWALLGPNGMTSELVAVPGGLPASGQPGWCEGSAGSCTTPAPYTYFGTQWQPGVTIDPRIAGHANHSVLWTAPANVDEGGISISGSIEQLFEQQRRLRISVYKNGSATTSAFFDSLPPIVNGVLLQRVDFGPAIIPVQPGDTLNFILDGSGAGGDGVGTFAAWDVTLREFRIPEPSSLGLFAIGSALVAVNRRRR